MIKKHSVVSNSQPICMLMALELLNIFVVWKLFEYLNFIIDNDCFWFWDLEKLFLSFFRPYYRIHAVYTTS